MLLKYDWIKGRKEVWKLEEELDKDAVCVRFFSNYTANTLQKKLSKGLETSKQYT